MTVVDGRERSFASGLPPHCPRAGATLIRCNGSRSLWRSCSQRAVATWTTPLSCGCVTRARPGVRRAPCESRRSRGSNTWPGAAARRASTRAAIAARAHWMASSPEVATPTDTARAATRGRSGSTRCTRRRTRTRARSIHRMCSLPPGKTRVCCRDTQWRRAREHDQQPARTRCGRARTDRHGVAAEAPRDNRSRLAARLV